MAFSNWISFILNNNPLSGYLHMLDMPEKVITSSSSFLNEKNIIFQTNVKKNQPEYN